MDLTECDIDPQNTIWPVCIRMYVYGTDLVSRASGLCT